MQALAYRAYGQVTQRTATGRSLEYALFEQITQALQAVHDIGAADPAEWADALYRNLQMWTIFSADLLSAENALPQDTKAGLLSLSDFVRRTSLQVFGGSEGILNLIEVNRTIMAGLVGSPAMAGQEEI